MPFAVHPIAALDSNYKQEYRFLIDGGVLEGATLRNAGALSGNNMAFAQIWVSFDDTPTNTDGILLAQGPLGASAGISWTGAMSVTNPMSIRVCLWVDFEGQYECVVKTSKKTIKSGDTENANR